MAGPETSELIGLLRLLAQTAEGSSLSESLSVVARMAAMITKAPCAGIFLEDPESGVLRLVASHGLEVEESSRVGPISVENPPGDVEGRRSLFIPRGGVPGAKRAAPSSPFSEGSLWVAVRSGGRPVGRLVVQTPQGIVPDKTVEEFLRLIAVYAGSVISNTRLYGALQRRVEELTVLYEVGHSLASTLDLDRVLGRIVDGIARLTGCEACSIMLLDGDVLRIHKARGLPQEVVEKAQRRLGEGISGRVAQTGEPMFVRDVEQARGIEVLHADRYRSRSLICVPLKARGRVIGVLNANDKKTGDFTPEDFNLVTLFASQAALAIDNAALHNQLWRSSVTDGLTQTYVRAYFKQRLDQAIASAVASGTPLGLIMVDLDHFKDVNDRYGHPAGDEVLRQLSSLLRRAVRSNDLVARYGGEEFVLVLCECGPEVVLSVAERIRKTLQQSKIRLPPPSTPLKEPSTVPSTITVTASFGVAMLPLDASDAESLIRIADGHLYTSKRLGRNRVSCSEEVRAAASSRPQTAVTTG